MEKTVLVLIKIKLVKMTENGEILCGGMFVVLPQAIPTSDGYHRPTIEPVLYIKACRLSKCRSSK
jgi:hypothetical protein